ncbi:MAG: hypothetical protein IT198_14070 [Acidimicrobiia bacterium]|nr:hypothetical protein [Acidimicrobiia bacterium]
MNLGLADSAYPGGYPGVVAPDRDGGFGAVVSEAGQGNTDLNGDGDTDDSVLHLVTHTGAATNLGLATVSHLDEMCNCRFPSLDDGGLAFTVSEPEQGGTDLNGDGDSSDFSVLHTVDPGGTVTDRSNALPWGFAGVGLDGGGLAFGVSESGQGGIDLNGDGDLADFSVLHMMGSDGSVTNVGLETDAWIGGQPDPIESIPGLRLDGGGLAFWVPEAGQGSTDLSGDGDTDDPWVLHVIDGAGSVTNLAGQNAAALLDGGLLYDVYEYPGGPDLNGDGDTSDPVLHVRDSAGNTTNLGLAGEGGQGVDADLSSDGRLVFEVSEAGQGNSDLNGNGSHADMVLHLRGISGTVTNLGVAGNAARSLYGPPVETLVVGVSEQAEESDMNGDGDTDDHVAHLVEPNMSLLNLGLAGFPWGWSGPYLALGVKESDQGADLNGDGDSGPYSDEEVPHVIDAAGNVTNIGLAGGAFPLEDGRFALVVSEANQGATDLNADGDATDWILHLWEPDLPEPQIGRVSVPAFGIDVGSADLLSSDATIVPSPFDGQPASVNADLVFETEAGQLQLTVSLTRLWILPFYLGQVRFSGPSIPTLNTLHLGPIAADAMKIVGRSSWFTVVPPFTLKPYTILWEIPTT